MARIYSNKELFNFINRAGKATYAGDGKEVRKPERPGFIELTYVEGDLSYRDSYTGHYRSRVMEIVRQNGKPRSFMYGGGMSKGQEKLTRQTFAFLKKAISTEEAGFDSFRGPHNLKFVYWEYKYDQDGGVDEFHGYEEIYFKGRLVFYHRIIGGIVIM